MFSDVRRHVAYQLANAPVRAYPFPHVVVPEIFPPEFYPLLRASLPPDDAYVRLNATGRVGGAYSPARLAFFPGTQAGPALDPGRAAFWNGFFGALLHEELSAWITAKFYDVLARRFALRAGGPGIDLETEIFLMRDLESYALGPHSDSPRKAVSVLFYLPERGDRPELGTSLYRPKDPGFRCPGGPHHRFEDFERIATIPYRPNTLFAFPKTMDSFHGVEPVVGAGARRDVMLLDLKVRVGMLGAEAARAREAALA
jgi:hypothetical protein